VTNIVITPPGRFTLPRLRELWEAREVFLRFGLRDITLRYRQTALGVIWVVLQPLLAAGVFSIVFGTVADLPSGGVPYFIFSYAGLLAWNVFNGIVTRSSSSLVANQALVAKVFFPRMLVPLSTVVSVLLDFVVALAMFVVLLFVYDINPGWPVLLLPVWLLLTVMLAVGVGVSCSALMVRYRDVAYIVPVALQILLYASPIAYSLSAVPPELTTLYNLNPLTWLLQEFRWSLLGQTVPYLWQIIASVLVSFAALLFGAIFFQQFEREFADVI
jgi:lipopolysaccharide transport system permease protein